MSAKGDHLSVPAQPPDGSVDWQGIEQSPEYGELKGMQRRFLAPATVVYLAGYFGFLVLAASRPGFFGTRLHGGLNTGLLLMVAAYVLVWLLIVVYIRAANRRFDPQAANVRAVVQRHTAQGQGPVR
jgi:uncharacterized membrane protein (DUF485 family)